LFTERTSGVALAWWLFGSKRSPWIAAAGALGLLGLVRTLSVGGWFGFGIAALVLVALWHRRAALTAALALVVVFGAALIMLPADRGLDRFNPTTGTGTFRVQIWTSSLQMVHDHPILGIGMDNFLYLYRDRYILPEAWQEPNISHPHNWLLQFWLELGLPGLLAWTAAMVWMARIAHHRFYTPRRPTDRLLGAAGLTSIIAVLTHGSIDNSYFLVDLASIWWAISGLLALPAPPTGLGETAETDSIEWSPRPVASGGGSLEH
jgi:O-antigen ligase